MADNSVFTPEQLDKMDKQALMAIRYTTPLKRNAKDLKLPVAGYTVSENIPR